MRRQMIGVWCLCTLLVWLVGTSVEAQAQQLSAKDLAANQELDRKFVEAYNNKDVETLMSCLWNSPNLVVALYGSPPVRGWEAVRRTVEQFFAGLESAQLEIVEVTHLRASDGVMAVGTASYRLQPKEGPLQQFTGRWSDLRLKVRGQWVYALDHAEVLPPAGPQATDALYKRLGGYDALAALVDDFLPRLLNDAQLKRFFGGVSTNSGNRIRQLIVDQLCAATGGPCVYIGRDMKTAHAGLGISGADWDRSVELLVATLDKFQVPAKEKGEVLAALSALKPDIVEK